MFEMIIALFMIVTGLSIGIARKKYALKGELFEIATTLFLLMGWFQAAVHGLESAKLHFGFSLTENALIAFVGLSSVFLTGLSLFGISVVATKKPETE